MCWQQCKLKIPYNRARNSFRAKMIKFSAEWCKAPLSTVICTRKEKSLAVSVTLRKTFLCALWQGMSNKMSLNCSTTIAFFLLLCKCHGSSPPLKQMRHSTPLTTNRSSWLAPGTQHQWYQSAPSLLLPGLWLPAGKRKKNVQWELDKGLQGKKNQFLLLKDCRAHCDFTYALANTHALLNGGFMSMRHGWHNIAPLEGRCVLFILLDGMASMTRMTRPREGMMMWNRNSGILLIRNCRT